ncbi:Muskelin [Blattella germanica]|nr:Muskelin [Blattella germanica]
MVSLSICSCCLGGGPGIELITYPGRPSMSLCSKKSINVYVIHSLFLSRQIHYLFGGNPGRACLPKLRLDDFWQLQLCRPTHAQLLQRCKLLIRKHRYFQLLTSVLFREQEESNMTSMDELDCHNRRSQLFDQLVSFFPDSMTQPTGNLMDLIPL